MDVPLSEVSYYNVSPEVLGLFLPVSVTDDLYTFLGDTILQAEPIRLNYGEVHDMDETEKLISCSIVSLSKTSDRTKVIGNLIPLGATSTLQLKSYSVLTIDVLNSVLNCLDTENGAVHKRYSADSESIDSMFMRIIRCIENRLEMYRNKPLDNESCYDTAALAIFSSFNKNKVICNDEIEKLKTSFSTEISPWLKLYAVIQATGIAIILNSDSYTKLYRYIVKLGGLVFNEEDIPALRVAAGPLVLSPEMNQCNGIHINFVKMSSPEDYKRIANQSKERVTEKCTVLYGVRLYVSILINLHA